MIINVLLKALKPFRLVTLIVTYILGVGLVQYVQSLRRLPGALEGIIFLILFSISVELLRLLQKTKDVRQWPENANLREIRQSRWVIAITTAVLMTVAITLIINWMVSGVLWQGLVFLVMALLLVGAVYYLSEVLPQLHPYQLLFETIFYVTIPPAFGYFLQSQEPHQFLTLVVIGLIPAYLAFRFLEQIQNFGNDFRYENRTLIVTIGWDRGMVFHNALILLTFVIFALTVVLDFPWFLLWPVFLALPLGLLEIWLMERVRRGGKPYWLVMKIATASILFLPIYLLGFAFWIR